MNNREKYFIATVNRTICTMPANYTGYKWHDYQVSFKVQDNKVITMVDGKEFVDDMPMKGSRRDRKALGLLVSTHIAETWGGTMEEVINWGEQVLEEMNELFMNF